jgi:hypothetical protein
MPTQIHKLGTADMRFPFGLYDAMAWRFAEAGTSAGMSLCK